MQARSKISEAKKREVELIKGIIGKYKTIGLLDLMNLPSPQLQEARKKLDVNIRVTKKRLLRIALNDIDKGVEKLEQELNNITPALILTNQSSFKLAKDLRKGRSFVAAKAGQIAPNDLIVKAGPTSLPPGPIIGELGSAGIKASVEQGKVTVREDSIIVRSGNVISGKAADVLSKLGIKPMEVGLNLVATYENGQVFRKDVLDIDEKFYLNTLKHAVNEALNLSVNSGYVTEENIELFFRKVEGEAKALESVAYAERDKVINAISSGEKEAEKIFDLIQTENQDQNQHQEGGN
ncbi:50S ribosomal protein L10 [Candidatus Woesearchaeota archaeon]|nr:50S ribosomal protein L10 [Candidatus Woesearchaeota archaeon]